MTKNQEHLPDNIKPQKRVEPNVVESVIWFTPLCSQYPKTNQLYVREKQLSCVSSYKASYIFRLLN